MNLKNTKHELQNILSGKSFASYDAPIQTIANNLERSHKSSPMAEEKHQNKAQETEKLKQFAIDEDWVYSGVDSKNFVSSGAEQKVYIKDEFRVLKLNDCIYYASWQDYFYSLLLHNYFFADTAYKLLGFNIQKDGFCAVVQQPFIQANELTELTYVKEFLENNGFKNTRNHDYYHPELGIILEDLHDENVLTKETVCFIL